VQTKTTVAVEVLRPVDADAAAPLLGVFDGADAVEPVVDPCLQPQAGPRRLESLTRGRAAARWSHAARPTPRAQGRQPRWGPRLAAPPPHRYGSTTWQQSRAWGDGRVRRGQDTPRQGHGSVSGAQTPGPVVVVGVDGDEQPWCVVTSALAVSAAQGVDALTARVRHADGCRDHTQRLGLEACRAWTTAPVLRTFQVPLVALPRRRLRPCRLEQTWGAERWWSNPAWSGQKRHASSRDLCRLFWRHRAVGSQRLIDVEDLHKTPRARASQGNSASRAA
jgi:hypothetical protein